MTLGSTRAPSCSACAEMAGDVQAPGGVIVDDGLWYVSHHTGPFTDPGELIVKTRRHCESLAELTPAEAHALGPVLRAGVRTASMPRGHVISDLYRRARNLLRKVGVLRNPTAEARADAAARVRQAWQERT